MAFIRCNPVLVDVFVIFFGAKYYESSCNCSCCNQQLDSQYTKKKTLVTWSFPDIPIVDMKRQWTAYVNVT